MEYDDNQLENSQHAQGAEIKAATPATPEMEAAGAIALLGTDIAVEQRAIKSATTKMMEVHSPLVGYRADFDRMDSRSKARCSWAEISGRLLANDSHYLKLAAAMNENGILFGVDKDGNPLFADGNDGPIMTGMNYKSTRDRVLYKHDEKDETLFDESGKLVPTGYEMFPYSEITEKSHEILMLEASTGKPFVKSPDGEKLRSSWVESGENPPWPRVVDFRPTQEGDPHKTYMDTDNPQSAKTFRGVKRMLRVKKT